MFHRIVLLAAALLLTACTTEVGGVPRPAQDGPVLTGLAALQPCEIFTPEQLAFLELKEPQYYPAEVNRKIPHGCRWIVEDGGSVDIGISTPEITVREYMAGAVADTSFEAGGLPWQVYQGVVIESLCDLVVEFPDRSWARVGSSDFSGDGDPCRVAKLAAPFVAGKLPGGAPAPPPPAKQQSPLIGQDPCATLTTEEAEQIGLRASSVKPFPAGETSDGCQWSPADESGGREDITVTFEYEESIADSAPGEKPDAEEDLGGRRWQIFDKPADIDGMCRVVTAVSESSHVAVMSSNFVAADKTCELAKAAAPLVAPKLPGS
ncbi:DUF3558 family protein [Amycolatopsis albispora]|uniref:DUF3558 domain-containing protein n=1 Tax=Amycolatopsis albispora TaxID=1804986 RepID=A0A344LCY5_9PSEU|nr:DUF3558 family protein [Amycolatopsis albispora]AXB45909.1 hypothetical protein A4R43_28350 [Amycolatopsis albispora]